MYPNKKSFSSVKWQMGKPNFQCPETAPFDSTELNRRLREYQKDPIDDTNQQYEKKVEQIRTCQKLVTTPFYMTAKEAQETKNRWVAEGKSPQFPLIVKRSRGSKKVFKIDDIIEENDEDVENENVVVDEILEKKSEEEKVKTVNQEGRKPGARGGSDHYDEEKQLITEYVTVHKKYLLIHMGYYFAYQQFYFPSEFAIAEFSVQSGLGDVVSGLIDIGTVPLGFRTDVDEQIKETFLPYPGYNTKFDAYNDALRLIEDFCRRHFGPEEEIYLFALKEYIPLVEDGIQWLTEKASEIGPVRQLNFKVLPVSVLVQVLGNQSQKPPYREKKAKGEYFISHDAFLDVYLHKSAYNHLPELGCTHHQKEENAQGVSHCAESIVKRYVFNASQVLLSLYNIDPLLNYHYPKVFLRNFQPLNFQLDSEDEYGYLKDIKPYNQKPKNTNTESTTDASTSTANTASNTSKTSTSSPVTTSNPMVKQVQNSTCATTGERKPLQLPDVTLVPRKSSSASSLYNRRRGINYADSSNSSSGGEFGGHFSRPKVAELVVAGPIWDRQQILNHFRVNDFSKHEGGQSYHDASLEPKVKVDEEDQFTDATQSDSLENVSSMSSTSTDSEPKCAYGPSSSSTSANKKGKDDSKLKDTSPLKPHNSLQGIPFDPKRRIGRGGPDMYRKILASKKFEDMAYGRGHGTGIIATNTRGSSLSTHPMGMTSRRHPQESDSDVEESSCASSSVGSYFGDSTSTFDEEGSDDEKDETTKSNGLGRGLRASK